MLSSRKETERSILIRRNGANDIYKITSSETRVCEHQQFIFFIRLKLVHLCSRNELKKHFKKKTKNKRIKFGEFGN